jgi:chromosome segregation ATPase
MQKDLSNIFGTTHGLDERSLHFLIKALERSNLPGFDYIEFKQSVANLIGMNIEEITAYKSVLATAMSMGLTKEKLLKSAHHYRQVLEEERTKFDAALQKQMQQKVQSKLEEVEQLKKQVADYAAKIEELEQRIAKATQTISNADEEVQEAKSKIEEAQTSFDFTHQSIMNQIAQDIENISAYL